MSKGSGVEVWETGKSVQISWKCRQYPKIRAWVPGKLKECLKANADNTKVRENYFELTLFCFFLRHGGPPPKALHQSGLTMGKMSVHGEPKFSEG